MKPQKAKRATREVENPPVQLPNPESKDEVLLKMDSARTLGEMLEVASLDGIRRGLALLPIDADKKAGILGQWARRFQPWPEWVFRVTVEILVVHYPRVRRQAILSALKGLHWFIFEAQIHGPPTPLPALAFSPDFSADVFSVFGHSLHYSEQLENSITKCEAGPLTPMGRIWIKDVKAKAKKKKALMWKLWRGYLEKRPEANEFRSLQLVVDAKRATLGKEGRARETQATAIYLLMLAEWPQIESFTGRGELRQLLNPLLGNCDEDTKIDRIKKLCRRIGLVFMKTRPGDTAGG